MEVEMKIMWCKGLTCFNFFQKLTVYAAVSLFSEDEKIKLTEVEKQEQKTLVDENGEGNPEWNYSMKFDLGPLITINPNMNGFGLQFELRTKGQLFGDKLIGEVRVPLHDLIQSVGFNVVRFVKYEVRSPPPDAKPNGILDFSYKVIANNNNDVNVISSNHDLPITGYHHQHHHHHHHHGQQLYQSHHHHHHHHHDHHNDNSTNSEMIQYPIVSAPPLLYPPTLSSSSYYYSSSSSFTSTNATHYQSPSPLYPPPSSQTWAPTITTPPSHYPPLPLEQPYIYPPPQLQQQPQGPQPFGDAHWSYNRSDSYHQW